MLDTILVVTFVLPSLQPPTLAPPDPTARHGPAEPLTSALPAPWRPLMAQHQAPSGVGMRSSTTCSCPCPAPELGPLVDGSPTWATA